MNKELLDRINEKMERLDEKTKPRNMKIGQFLLNVGKRYRLADNDDEKLDSIMSGLLIIGGKIENNTSLISLGKSILGGK